MAVTLQSMYEEMRKTWQNMQEVIDVQEKEVKSFGQVSQETKTSIEKMNERLTQLETTMARPQFNSNYSIREEKPEAAEAKAAYMQALWKGYASLSPEQKKMVSIVNPSEVKVLQQVDETGGGYVRCPFKVA